jgi:hypothetical protein
MACYKLPFVGPGKLTLFADFRIERGEYVKLEGNKLTFFVLYTHAVRIADPHGKKEIILKRPEIDKLLDLVKTGKLIRFTP